MARGTGWILLAAVGCGEPAAPGDCDPSVRIDAFTDADNDGAGDPDSLVQVCSLGSDQVSNGDDCDDQDAAISPFEAEICDLIDQDCDGTPDDGLVGGTWYADVDGDGFGDPDVELKACRQPADSTVDHTDCDDAHEEAFPEAPEVCDDLDNNCDGTIDDGDPLVDRSTGVFYYRDADGDGYGDDDSGEQWCRNPSPDNLTDVSGDCFDADADIHPVANEICDLLDNNCDGLIDEADPLLDLSTAETFYEDLDGDGVGNANVQIQACFRGNGAADVGGDCDDTEPLLAAPGNWVFDNDGDGVGAGAVVGGGPTCLQPQPGTVPEPPVDDCNDANGAIYPGAAEVCGDGIDSDCDTRDCSDWLEGFEAGPPLAPEWTTNGNANWFVNGQDIHTGAFAGESGNIGDSQDSNLSVVLDFPVGGSLTFWHSGDTESNYDYLYFYVDNTQFVSRSGAWGWTQAAINGIAPGVHTLRWTYHKDGTLSIGADAIWIDDIVAVGGAL